LLSLDTNILVYAADGVFDARLLAVCNAHGCTHLLSEDLQDGARYGGVTVVDPFHPANAAAVESLFS
jgi:predicted nucleic acid-binding protein